MAPHCPASLLTLMSAGQVITGSSSSVTVTVKEQEAVPHEFVAVAVTVVVPTGKKLPEAARLRPDNRRQNLGAHAREKGVRPARPFPPADWRPDAFPNPRIVCEAARLWPRTSPRSRT